MFWTAFTIGLFGSLHCIGMCGPIALAMPLQQKSQWQLVQNSLLYNFGRALTYSLLGLLIGLLATTTLRSPASTAEVQTLYSVMGTSIF